MPPASPEDRASIRLPHPLADMLVERLRDRPACRVLDFASGGGRNTAALVRAGFDVCAIGDVAAASSRSLEDVEGLFAAALSTHGFLHGTGRAIADRAGAVAQHLEPGGLLYATFGSTRDARFGEGERIDAFTYEPVEGDERGVPHRFFTREQVQALLDPLFILESIEEHDVDEIAGSWAHRERLLHRAIHWFAIARLGAV